MDILKYAAKALDKRDRDHKTESDGIVRKLKDKIKELKDDIKEFTGKIKELKDTVVDLKRSLKSSERMVRSLEEKLVAIREGKMCPVCGRCVMVSKNETFKKGNQVIGHIRGMQDAAHEAYRNGL